MWAAWAVLVLVFVCLRSLPSLHGFAKLAAEHPAMLMDTKAILVLLPLVAWFTLGVLALVYLQAFTRRVLGARLRP